MMNPKEAELMKLVTDNIQLIIKRMDLISTNVENLLKRVESIEVETDTSEQVRVIKCAVEELQEQYEAPANKFVYHMASVFGRKGEKQ